MPNDMLISFLCSKRANSSQAPPKFHQRLMFFLQRAIDQVENLLDISPPEDIVCDLESIEKCVEQKLTDDQIARLYGWYTPTGQPDRKKVKAAKAGDVPTSTTVTQNLPPHYASGAGCQNFA